MVILVLTLTLVYAEEKDDKISGLVVLKSDWISPVGKGESYFVPALCPFLKYKSWGGGFDLRYYESGKVTEFQPYLTFTPKGGKSPWYFLGGLSFDTNNAKYAQTGVWYINNFGDLNVAVDVRNFWSLDSDKAKGFIEPFLQLLYPFPKFVNINKRFCGGVELDYVHWWSGDNHNWFLAGPVVGFKITDNLSTFVRVSKEWTEKKDDTTSAYRVRVGLNITF
jgi:hypothetical protein